MDPRTVTLMAGLFSTLNSIQFLIFDLYQLTHIGYEDKYSIYLDTSSKAVSWFLSYRSSVTSVMALVTVAMGCGLLCSVHRNSYLGPLLYALWIVAYELATFSLLLLCSGLVHRRFGALPRLYLVLQGSRMALHFACLPAVLRHAYELFKAFRVVNKVSRRRRSSVSTVDSFGATGLRLMYRRLT
ncbi:transmembrane protein 217 [Octodon degus]|uniref:Transmembrane protein 217 n=1 Tax=Octodon degus TaxID=10160 RepID=A0A6P6F143_OCTDE|nr:transmembrane protein 217 [Octodon degus]